MIAALYVDTGGAYYGLPEVDPWDEARDARRYDGPWPVVAHPPCARWCALAPLLESLLGYRVGDDGGCFAAALAAVRRFGGVLEHPAYSFAWRRFELPRPARGYWSRSLLDQGWVTEVDQAAYGHPARKRTWLYYVGAEPVALDWSEPESGRLISSFRHGLPMSESERVRPVLAARTPPAFRDELLRLAYSVSPRGLA